MAYDFAGFWSPEPGHHAALYPSAHSPSVPSADVAIQYVLRQPGISPQKIVLGVPCYGRAFPRSPYLPHNVESTRRDNDESYGHAIEVRDLAPAGAQELIDSEVCAAHRTDEKTGEWVSYDNPGTVALKAKYVREQGLGGFTFWEACQDHEGTDKSLVFAGYMGLFQSNSKA